MRCITLEHLLVAVWIKTLLNTAKTFFLYGRQLCLFSMNVRALTGHDKGLLEDKPMAPRPSGKHVGLGLT